MANITIIGTGRMATQLGTGWARAGHAIIFASRDPQGRGAVADQVPGARVTTPAEALAGAAVVALALPFAAALDFAADHAAALHGPVVIDLSNPFGRELPGGLSGAEITAATIGNGARVVAAFKTNFYETLLEPVDPINGLARDVHLAGDDAGAKEVVAALAADLGFRPVDCGPLRNARLLDGLVPLLVELDRRYAAGGRRASWKLLT